MNLMPELAAAANFGTGYNEGAQQATNEHFANTMNSLLLRRTQSQADMEQKLQQHMMQLFQPKVINPVNGQPIGQQAPPPPQPPSPEQHIQDVIGKLTQGGEYALSIGDVAQGNELLTNAMNMRGALAQQAQRQAAVQMAQVKRQAYNHKMVADTLGAATSPQEWNAALQQVLADPTTTPEEARNLSQLQYSPETVARIRQSGMNSYQQAQLQMSQQRMSQQQSHDAALEQAAQTRARIAAAHEKAQEAHWRAQEKGGGRYASPSRQDIATAAMYLRPHMYPGQTIDEANPPPELGMASSDVAARAKQLTVNNKALTYPQAVQMVINQELKSGQIKATAPVKGGLFGIGAKPGSTEYHSGDTESDPIPFDYVTKASDLEAGKYYSHKGKLYVAHSDGKLYPVQ